MNKSHIFIILRAVEINGICVEKDRFMGTAPTNKQANDIASIFNDDVKNGKHHALADIKISFYVREYE